ncbi:MAG: butyrate kinase [Oscillospiraceae bacterium]|jgi:butyrate kinase|nr:butyrate kinase [Oscillospiraceae bacterium]
MYRILAINPGSTSTKIALFEDGAELFRETVRHAPAELAAFPDVQSQLDFRAAAVENALAERRVELAEIDVFVGRGGGLLPVEGGVYVVDDFLCDHASRGMSGQHPAQLAAQICRQYADRFGKPAFVVNPPDTDEFIDVSRVTGLRGVERESHVHALNQKEIALRFCKERGLKYEDTNLVICHLGGGISVTAHRRGRMIDSNDVLGGSGPFTPNRSGDLPYIKVLDLAFSGEYTQKQLVDRLNKNGGLTDLFGTADVRELLRLADGGDERAALVFDAMVYSVAKYAGAMAVTLRGDTDAIILTGGIANERAFTDKLTEYLAWIAEVVVKPGEFELEALAAGALRVLCGEETAKRYTGARR